MPLLQRQVLKTVALALGTCAALAACGGGQSDGFAAASSAPNPTGLTVPAGFRIQVYERGLSQPRFMAFAPNGDLVVSEPGSGNVVAITSAGAAPRIVASSLRIPHGLAFIGSQLFIAHWDGISSMAYPSGALRTVTSGFPENGDHNLRALAAGPDGALYVSIGSNCNACNDQPPLASVLRVTQAGVVSSYAGGLRNASGLAFDSGGSLWATVNQRDDIGPTQSVTDNLPPDEIDRLGAGKNFGWPTCYPDPNAGKRDPNPEYPQADCSAFTPAALNLQAHSAPLAIAFYYKSQFPAAYRGGAFVAFHGSWDRSTPTGDKVVYVAFSNGHPTGYQDFITGWLVNGRYTGRPAGVAIGPDGALYVSDDAAGTIYRVSHG